MSDARVCHTYEAQTHAQRENRRTRSGERKREQSNVRRATARTTARARRQEKKRDRSPDRTRVARQTARSSAFRFRGGEESAPPLKRSRYSNARQCKRYRAR